MLPHCTTSLGRRKGGMKDVSEEDWGRKILVYNIGRYFQLELYDSLKSVNGSILAACMSVYRFPSPGWPVCLLDVQLSGCNVRDPACPAVHCQWECNSIYSDSRQRGELTQGPELMSCSIYFVFIICTRLSEFQRNLEGQTLLQYCFT